MSTPAEEAALRESLMATNPHYRELAEEHHRYDERLNQLAAIHFPSEEEQLEEITLKKKKLALKDQMEEIAAKHKASSASR